MTDRHAGYIVILERDMREDSAEPVLTALRMVKGVARVIPVEGDFGPEQAGAFRRDLAWRAALDKLAIDGPDP